MKNYRLKSEAVPFFKEKHATSIYSYDTWEKLGVDEKALEEIKEAYIIYGHETKKETYTSSSLGGWEKEKGTRFHFTIQFPGVEFMEHDKFSNGRVVRKLMDDFQRKIDNFYSSFVNKENEVND